MRLDSRNSLMVIAAALALGSLLATPVGGAKATVDIDLNSVTVASTPGQTSVTLNVTNNTTVAVGIEVNVQALVCDFAACDLDTTTNQCAVADIGGESGSLAAGATADFAVTFSLAAGNHLFVAKAVGNKGSSEDRRQSVVAAIVP